MSLRERLASVEADAELKEAEKVRIVPTGWEPGVTWNPAKGGTITAGPFTTPPDPAIWAELIADWGLDPTITEVVPGTVQVRGWDSAIGGGETRRMKYYKATLRPATGAETTLDLEELYKEVLKAKPGKKVYEGDSTLLVCLSDFQLGNSDNGGVDEQIACLARLVGSVPERVKSLRKQGHEIGCICIAGLGDLVENCSGFYSAQQFRVELDHREQIKVVRRALRDILMAVAPLAPEIKVVCVPGNHGERRLNGKAFTRVGDNDDVAVFEQVAEILAQNTEAYGHVKWRIPGDEVVVTVDLSGVMTSFTHGHVAKSKGNAAETLWQFWRDHSMGRKYPAFADSTLCVAGHYHHFCAKEQEGRSLFICPSLTEVSEYFSDVTGMMTKPGTLTMLIENGTWTELAII